MDKIENAFTGKKQKSNVTSFVKFIAPICFFLLCLSCADKKEADVDEPEDEIPFSYSSVSYIALFEEGGRLMRELFIMDTSGNEIRRIQYDGKIRYEKPVRSHCGTKLLFVADERCEDDLLNICQQGLYYVNTDGKGLTLIDKISGHVGYFSGADWSPDDTKIVYSKSDDRKSADLILYDLSKKIPQILSTKESIYLPKFSPDGKKIAYSSKVGIYNIDANGKNDQLIIKDSGNTVWSPHGDKMAYYGPNDTGGSQIFVADADGSNQKQLTFTVSPHLYPGSWPRDGNLDPQWTPDGKKIVYVSRENEKSEIFIMNADGSDQRRLTEAEYGDADPEITPDGKFILFSSNKHDMATGICIMTLDGQNQRVLTKNGCFPIVCR